MSEFDILPDEPRYKPYKAVVGAVLALAGLLVAAIADGEVTMAEYITIIPAVAAVAAGVYLIRNPPKV